MRTLKVAYRPEAIKDLKDIFQYIAFRTQNAQIAQKFVKRIKAKCDKIGDAPFGGRKRDDLAMNIRIVPFEKTAVIAYLVEENCVRIVNIFYGGKDYEALFRADDNESE